MLQRQGYGTRHPVLGELVEAGKVVPVIDRTYPLSDTAEAIGYLEQGHARGKVVITI
jgi:NADPH:quinone reductase-like Zn-dependent oxidoreductase